MSVWWRGITCAHFRRAACGLLLAVCGAQADEPLGKTMAVRPLQARLEGRLVIPPEAKTAKRTDEKLVAYQTTVRASSAAAPVGRQRPTQVEVRAQKTRRLAASQN